MKSDSELIAAANRSFVGALRTLVQHCPGGATHQSRGVFAFATGLPIAVFNGCAVVEPSTVADLDAALHWVRGRGQPFRLWIDERAAPGLDGVAAAHGLRREPAPFPGMVLHPVPDLPQPAAGVGVTPVTSEADLRDYRALCVEGGLPLDLARRIYSDSFAADPNVRLFIARLDGRAAGHSVAIRTGAVSGVYAVGTLAPARRRGVGAAATWAAVAAGRVWGSDTIVLQASELGLSLYAGMGFRTVVPYTAFRS
jgi:hypothetical protein